MQSVPIIGYEVIHWELDVMGPLRSVSTTKNIHNGLWCTKSTATEYYRCYLFMEHKLKCCCVWLWLRQGTASEPQLTEIHLHERGSFLFCFFVHHTIHRQQFYYWNCLLMIPNYPVEHSGEGQFQASNLCCNHRGNHTCNTAVASTSQQHKQEARELEIRLWVTKKVKSVRVQ